MKLGWQDKNSLLKARANHLHLFESMILGFQSIGLALELHSAKCIESLPWKSWCKKKLDSRSRIDERVPKEWASLQRGERLGSLDSTASQDLMLASPSGSNQSLRVPKSSNIDTNDKQKSKGPYWHGCWKCSANRMYCGKNCTINWHKASQEVTGDLADYWRSMSVFYQKWAEMS